MLIINGESIWYRFKSATDRQIFFDELSHKYGDAHLRIFAEARKADCVRFDYELDYVTVYYRTYFNEKYIKNWKFFEPGNIYNTTIYNRRLKMESQGGLNKKMYDLNDKCYLVIKKRDDNIEIIKKSTDENIIKIIENSELGKLITPFVNRIQEIDGDNTYKIQNYIQGKFLTKEERKQISRETEISLRTIKEVTDTCSMICNLILQADTYAERESILIKYNIIGD